MIVVLHLNPQNGQLAMTAEGGTPDMILQALQTAAASVQQQLNAPKLHLPNGQVKPVIPQENP
jgi:hypothetical protein